MSLKPGHFYYGIDWERTDFFPFFTFTLAHKMKCGDCPLAVYNHPLVQDEDDEHSYNKLCTLQVIRSGLLDLKTVFKDIGGCGSQPDDYKRAKRLMRVKL